MIDRVCIPTSKVFLNAFSSYTATFSSAVRQAGVANFITDIQNVDFNVFRIGDGLYSLWSFQFLFPLSLCSSLDASQDALYGFQSS